MLACVRRHLGTADDADRRELAAPAACVPEVDRCATHEGLEGIVSFEARHGAWGGETSFPPRYRRVFHRNAAALATIAVIGERLSRKGARAIVLKGASLLATAYGCNLGLRPMGDVDLLVPPWHRVQLHEALVELGFRDYGFCYRRAGVDVDPHVDLLGAEHFPTRRLAYRFDPALLWRDARPFGPAVPAMLRLADVPQLLHQAIHALRHSFVRWVWLVDLALLLRRVEVEELGEAAERANAVRPLAWALLAMEELLHVPMPAALRRRLPLPGELERRLVRDMTRAASPLRCGEALSALAVTGFGDRAAYLREVAFPPDRVLRAYYPASSRPGRYARRLRVVASRLSRLGPLSLVRLLSR